MPPEKETKPAVATTAPTTSDKTASSNSPEKPLPPGWARIASKKRPGKYYYFNASTNTSLWEHPARALAREAKIVANVVGAKKTTEPKTATAKVTSEEKVVQLKNDGQFKRKNLAKERMETLRTQLDEDRKVTRKTASPKRKPEVKASPKTSEDPVKKPDDKPTEKKSDSKSEETKTKSDIRKVESPRKSTAKKQEVSKTSPLRQKRKASTESPKRAKKKLDESPKRGVKSRAIVKKASPIVEAKPKAEKLEVIKKEAESLKKFKIPKKPPEEESVSSPFLVAIQKLVEEKPPPPEVPAATPKSIPQPLESPKLSSEPPPRSQSTPKEVREAFPKSPANDRLAQLRNQIAQNVTLDEDAEMTDLSIGDTSVATVTTVEEMDWEDIPEEVALQEVITIRRSLGLKIADSVLNTSIPETNLLDVQPTFNRFFLMVVDTNIFLSHLKTLEHVLATGIHTVGQPILILPYMVLQELDRIKHREAGRPLSQAASASIRFLNDHLKRRDPRVKGQSTIEAAAPLIPIENPDDHILDCALQTGRIAQGVELLLLSNDVNLRNKALVSGLTAVSFGELMAEAERLRKVAAAAATESGK